MALSEADRAALRARAAGLRAEVSSLKIAASAAVDEASAAVEDAKLLAEVERLEREKANAIAQRETAQGTVADAMKAMEEAAERLVVSSTAEREPTTEDESTVAGEPTTTEAGESENLLLAESTDKPGEGA